MQRHLFILLSLSFSLLSPTLAHASGGGPNGDAFFTGITCLPFVALSWIGGTSTANAEALSSSTGQLAFGLLSAGAFTIGGGITTTTLLVKKSKRTAAVIEVREEELRRAVALGAGELVHDLATWLAIPEGPARRRFGLMLRRDRARILAALDEPTPIERGWVLLHILHSIEAELRAEFALPHPTRRHVPLVSAP